MECECGFKFSDAGEFRNCVAFVTKDGQGGVFCPKCGTAYINDKKVPLKSNIYFKERDSVEG